jgi:hypothetical protein
MTQEKACSAMEGLVMVQYFDFVLTLSINYKLLHVNKAPQFCS